MKSMETMENLEFLEAPGFIKIIKTIEKKRAKVGKKCEKAKKLIKKGKKVKNRLPYGENFAIHCVRSEEQTRTHGKRVSEWSAFAVREAERLVARQAVGVAQRIRLMHERKFFAPIAGMKNLSL